MWGEIIKALAYFGVGYILEDVKKEYSRWLRTREEVQVEIIRQRNKVKEYLARQYYDYKVMVNLHYQSFCVADQAYILLRDSRKSIEALNKTIFEIKLKKEEILLKREKRNNTNEKDIMIEEINGFGNLRRKLFDDRDILKGQRDGFYQQVKELNEQTHFLKIAIRDKTGSLGLEWFERLENRIRGNRLEVSR